MHQIYSHSDTLQFSPRILFCIISQHYLMQKSFFHVLQIWEKGTNLVCSQLSFSVVFLM
ncbi:hypothetical protein MKW92_049839 [Papaver armeniacum]|nr:hypothetical protein MKW92_049839 [Papaver armeniacum]